MHKENMDLIVFTNKLESYLAQIRARPSPSMRSTEAGTLGSSAVSHPPCPAHSPTLFPLPLLTSLQNEKGGGSGEKTVQRRREWYSISLPFQHSLPFTNQRVGEADAGHITRYGRKAFGMQLQVPGDLGSVLFCAERPGGSVPHENLIESVFMFLLPAR